MGKPSNATETNFDWSDFGITVSEVDAPEWAREGCPPGMEIIVVVRPVRAAKTLWLSFSVPAHLLVPELAMTLAKVAVAALRNPCREPSR
jgi:hypothetical protein